MTLDFEARLRRLEDRHAISERVIKYAVSIDRADWAMFAACFTDPVFIDFSAAGMPAQDFARTEFVEVACGGLAGFTARQHLSPNHLIEFDDADPDRAVCHSYMYAQHYLAEAKGGDFYLMRGSYTNYLQRTADGWQIARLIQHVSWPEGNRVLPALAAAQYQEKPAE